LSRHGAVLIPLSYRQDLIIGENNEFSGDREAAFFIALFGMVFAVILCLASNFPSSTGVWNAEKVVWRVIKRVQKTIIKEDGRKKMKLLTKIAEVFVWKR
jgi:hypothetical protein